MKTIRLSSLLFVPLIVIYDIILEAAGEPCSTAANLPVVDICTDDTKIQDASNTVIIKADVRQNCTCKLSVDNQDQAITVHFQKYNQATSSCPSHYGCGLILLFGIFDRIWEAQCRVGDNIYVSTLAINGEMTIRSLTVNGTLKQNEGYCIEIRNGVHNDSLGNKLKVTCGIGSASAHPTTASIAKTTRSSTEITNPLPFRTTRTTEHLLTTLFNYITVTNTDIPHTTKQTNRQQKYKDIDDRALYVSISASVVGVGLVIIVTITVVYYKRFQKLTQCKSRTCSGSNTFYDTLSLPANTADNGDTSNNYSSLNINDCQSSYDNRRLEGSQNIPLATISTVQGTNINVPEKEKNYEKTNKGEYYTNLVF